MVVSILGAKSLIFVSIDSNNRNISISANVSISVFNIICACGLLYGLSTNIYLIFSIYVL